MAFISIPNVVMAELRMTIYTQQVENTVYFKRAEGWDASTAATLGTALRAWWVTEIAPLVSSQLALTEIYLTDQEFPTGFAVSQPVSPAENGELLTAALPSSVSLAVSFRTGLRGRSYRGRNFIVGLVEAQVDDNEVTEAVATGFAAAYENLSSVGVDVAAEWVVASRYANGAPRSPGISTPVSSVQVVDRIVDTQRRRLNGRGR